MIGEPPPWRGDRQCDRRASARIGQGRSGRRAATLLLAGLLAGVVGSAAPAAVIEAPSATVIDGDTIDLGPVRIRIHRIDAPEAGQRCDDGEGGAWPCGDRAIRRMAELVESEPVSCEALERERYGRIIAICRVRGVDIGAQLVSEGLAWAFRRYSTDYAGQEDEARRARRGVWRGDAETPWDYRANRWSRAAAAAPKPGCPIKGNINSSGEKIYHTPWSPWYARTSINPARGERWFCDEADAVAAGWRPARWR